MTKILLIFLIFLSLAGLTCAQNTGSAPGLAFGSTNIGTGSVPTTGQCLGYNGTTFGGVSCSGTPTSNAINVAAAPYNADTTGNNDTSTAINNAMVAALGSNPGGIPNLCRPLYFPTGNYKISGNLTNLKGGLAGCGFYGDGPTSTYLNYSGSNTFMFTNNESVDGSLNHFFIRNMAFAGPSGLTKNWMSEVGSGNDGDWLIQDVEFTNWNIIFQPTGTAAADTTTFIHPVTFSSNTFLNPLSAQNVPLMVISPSLCTNSDTFLFSGPAASVSVHGGYLCIIPGSTAGAAIFHYGSGFSGSYSAATVAVSGVHIELGTNASGFLIVKDDAPSQPKSWTCTGCQEDTLFSSNAITLRSDGRISWIGGNLGGFVTLDTDSSASNQAGAGEIPPIFIMSNTAWDVNSTTLSSVLIKQTCTSLASCSTISSGNSLPISYLTGNSYNNNDSPGAMVNPGATSVNQ